MNDSDIYEEVAAAQRKLIEEVLKFGKLGDILDILYFMHDRDINSRQCADILFGLFHQLRTGPLTSIKLDSYEALKMLINEGNGLFYQATQEEENKIITDIERLKSIEKKTQDSVIIRFYCYKAFENGVPEYEPKIYIESLGMEIIKDVFSDFSSCYFMEVRNFVSDPKDIYVKMETKSKEFNWKAV